MVLFASGCSPSDSSLGGEKVSIFTLTSPAFSHRGKIPLVYTCDGKNISPPLKITGIPQGTVTLVLIMEDPDVPRHLRADGMWDHWIVFNIPPTTTLIAEGEEPQGVHGKGTGGNLNYYGPCPPDREHRYFFRLYALDHELDLPQGSSKAEVKQSLKGHVLAETSLEGLYGRR